MSASATPGRLEGRVVLVVGATGGLGSAAAKLCAQEGAEVILLGRKLAKLHRVNDAIAAAGGRVSIYPLDLEGAAPDDYIQMAERIGENFGRLDGILHCAAHFSGLVPLQAADPADIARAMHVNVTAPAWLTMAAMPVLQQSDAAAVVVVADDPARVVAPFWGGYGLSQAARVALVEVWGRELPDQSHVRVSGLMPGPMRTALRARAWMHDTDPRLQPPEHWAPACVELLAAGGLRLAGRWYGNGE